MNNINLLYETLKIARKKALFIVAGSFLLISCGTQMGGYTETDGVYYDPKTDTLPEGVIINNEGNVVGDYYNYQNSTPIISNSEMIAQEQENRYQDWNSNATDSDWGSFAGSDINYYDNNFYGWNSPWGFGFNNFGGGFGWGMGFNNWGWGSPWGFGFNNWGWGNPWGFGFNNWGWGSPWGFNNFYGNGFYGNGFYGNGFRYQRSGANGRSYNSYSNGFTQNGNKINSNGFRNANNQNSGRFRNDNSNGVMQRSNNTPRYRNQSIQNSGNMNSTPRYRNQQIQSPTRNDTRNNSYRNDTNVRPMQSSPSRSNSSSGGFNSGSSGSSSSGGSRSGGGGFRR